MTGDFPLDVLNHSAFSGVNPVPAPALTTMQRMQAAFPFPVLRRVQTRSLAVIADSYDSGKTNTIIEAPTGSGKSGMSMAIGTFAAGCRTDFPGAHILTSQNNLLNQMMEGFGPSGLVEIRGKANYTCEPHHTNCGTGSLLNGGKKNCPTCPYREAKKLFVNSPVGITNYTYYLTERRYAKEINSPHYLILDEAHNIEDEVLGIVHIDITQSRARELGITLPGFDGDQGKVRSWLDSTFLRAANKYHNGLRSRIAEAQAESASRESSEHQKNRATKLIRELLREQASLVSLAANVDNYLDEESMDWLAWTDKGQLTIRPLSAARYAQRLLFSKAKHVLMMSATLLDFKTLQRNLGINPATTNTFAAQSDFPVANRRIVYWPTGSMSYKDADATIPRIAARTEKLLEKYANDKGIIHSHSYKINAYLEKYFAQTKHRDRIITHTNKPGEREAAIARHIGSKCPTILLSPSITEGLDLKGDLSRLQIITKIPYPLLDAYTRARMERDDKWYQLKTALTLVQATGRSVRSEDDWAITVILDSAFERFLNQNQSILPEWWKAAIEFPTISQVG